MILQPLRLALLARALLAVLITFAAGETSAANWIERWPWASIELGAQTWRAVPEREIDALGESLVAAQGELAGKLRRGLATPAGRLELDARLAIATRDARYQGAVSAMSAYLKATLPVVPPHGGDGTIAAYRLLAEHPEYVMAPLQVLSSLLDRIRAGLPADRPLAARLTRLLARPQAAAAVLVAYMFPAAYPNPLYSKTGGWFRRRTDASLVLLASRRTAVAGYGASLQPLRAAVDRVTVEFGQIGARLAGTDALSRRLASLLRDPIYAAVNLLLAASRAPKTPADRLAEQLIEQANTYLEGTGGRLRLKDGVDRKRLDTVTQTLERLVFAARISRARLTPFIQAIDDSGAPEQRMKELLSSNLAAVSFAFEAARTKTEDRFLRHTVLGSALLAKGKTGWRVNPKRTTQLRLQLEFLESLLDNYRLILDRVRGPEAATPAYVHVGRLAVLAAEAARARTVRAANWQRWLESRFRSSGRLWEPRREAEPELRTLAGAMEATAADVDAHEPAIGVNFSAAAFDKSRLRLLRSSAFFNPRTPFGQQAYLSGFKDHYAARFFGVFDFPAGNARDRADFTRLLNRHSRWILGAGPFHDRIMVYISAMPRWLSMQRDERKRHDVPAYTLYSTKDWNGWADVVRETVRLVRQIRGPQRYYEVWNEPESYWAAGTDAYLKLYEETARIIRAEDPEAKIGGAAVNAWKGRAGGSRGGDALNLELIRYAKRNGVPLDFVSWHHFSAPLKDLQKAKSVYLAEVDRLRLSPVPEMIVSEWNPPGENTGFEAVSFAETMRALYRSDVAFHTVAAWEEFGAIPNPKAFGPWGMITQQHFVKPMAHVHALFDRIARDSLGVAELTPPESTTRVIASRKPGGVYELLIWEVGYEPALEAALKALGKSGLGRKEAAAYGSLTDLEDAIRTGVPRNAAHRKAFEQARRAYDEHRQQRNFVHLKVAGVNHMEVLASSAVASIPVARPVRTVGAQLLADVRRNEVLWLRLRVGGGGG